MKTPYSNTDPKSAIRPNSDTSLGATERSDIRRRLAELEEMERHYKTTLENLYLHQEELKTQNDELRHAQVSLEKARRRHQDLFDFSPVAQFLVSPNGMILKSNRVAGTLLGLDCNDLYNYHMPNLAGNNSDRVMLLNFLSEVGDNKTPSPITVDLFRRDGRNVRVQFHGSRSGAQQETSLLLTAVDNSRLAELEQERAARQDIARLYEALLKQCRQPVFITDPAWRIVQVNAEFQNRTGYRPEDILDRKLETVAFQENAATQHWQVWEILQTQGRWQGETLLLDADNNRHSVSMSIAAVLTPSGQVQAYLGVY